MAYERKQNLTQCSKADCRAIYLTVDGEPVSKANSRRLVHINGKPRFIKSQKGLALQKVWDEQCPRLNDLLDMDVVAYIHLYYASRRPDLDESLVLDFLQGKVIKNDRSIRERHTYWGLDPIKPRSSVLLIPLATRSCCNADGCLFAKTFNEEGCI